MCAEEGFFSRRQLLEMSLALGGVFLSGPLHPVFSQSTGTMPTSEQPMGPFFPVLKPADQDADLTVIRGKTGKAEGQVIRLRGRVFNLKGQPMPGARVEIWQANAFGRYTHPGDTNPAPLDPHFQGYGLMSADADGWYGFKTVKPAPYPAAAGWTRPPHIHFQVTTKTNRLVTQMYFPGEPLNEKDRLFKTAADKGSLIVKLTPSPKDTEPGVLLGLWDIVFPRT